jgi:hypothetical protein
MDMSIQKFFFSRIFSFACCFLLNFYAASAQPGEWTWMHGSNLTNATGSFGTQGISSPSNDPPSFYEASDWTDQQGNFWLFGGFCGGVGGFYGDMWKFTPSTNEWTWVHGNGIVSPAAIYGVLGVPSPANSPGGDHWCAATWTDNNGMLWLFGGGVGGTSSMWMYNPGTNEWAWMNGPTTGAAAGVFGTQGVSSPSNYPPSRWETNGTWVDAQNNLWLFGGLGNNGDDLWKYNSTTNEWTWMKGSAGAVNPVYGTMNISAPGNTPGGRQVYAKWKDVSGDFWLFGGSGEYNDLWKYSPASNEWTWTGGTSFMNDPGTYTATCASSTTELPSARHENRACWTDANGFFWFFSGYNGPVMNDLWKYCPVSGKWTWVHGPSTPNGTGVYGTQGVSSPANIPGARMGSTGWKDLSGNFWVFGGYVGVGPTGNDLWRFVPDPACGDNVCSTVPTALFSAPNHICPGTCTDFTNLSQNATSFLWNFPGATPSTSVDINPTSICYNTPGTYQVELIATNATGADTLTLNNYITVFPSPPPQGIMQSGDTLFANQGSVSYQWYYNGNLIPGATDYNYLATQSGNYNVVCTDANDCEVEAAIFDVAAGIYSAVRSQQLAIYPNPASDLLYINIYELSGTTADISIFNMIGEKIMDVEFQSENSDLRAIDVHGLSSGIYWIESVSGEKKSRAKFVKQ